MEAMAAGVEMRQFRRTICQGAPNLRTRQDMVSALTIETVNP